MRINVKISSFDRSVRTTIFGVKEFKAGHLKKK